MTEIRKNDDNDTLEASDMSLYSLSADRGWEKKDKDAWYYITEEDSSDVYLEITGQFSPKYDPFVQDVGGGDLARLDTLPYDVSED